MNPYEWHYCGPESQASIWAFGHETLTDLLKRELEAELMDIGARRVKTFNRGAEAAQTFLEPREAAVFVSVGYPVIIAVAGTLMIAAHATIDSLINRPAVGGEWRENGPMNIVHVIIKEFTARGIAASDISMRLYLAPIRALRYPFTRVHKDGGYTEAGERNRKLHEFVTMHWPKSIDYGQDPEGLNLNIGRLMELQANECGVRNIYREIPLEGYALAPELVFANGDAPAVPNNLIIIMRDA
ncbi:MAG TPA: hypothetical protein VMV50_00700 [Candidatus Paceibacterota bacterium]|nr:hypothetical protein [Candidatus Paceibacterota bacterium]